MCLMIVYLFLQLCKSKYKCIVVYDSGLQVGGGGGGVNDIVCVCTVCVLCSVVNIVSQHF